MRKAVRQELDNRLAPMTAAVLAPPAKGWIRVLRDALGMTGSDVAARMGVTQSRVAAIERAEVNGTVKLDTLQRAAEAMGCKLVYALVPLEGTLDGMVRDQARNVARDRLARAAHTMRLEGQEVAVDPVDVEELALSLLDRHDLWRDRPA